MILNFQSLLLLMTENILVSHFFFLRRREIEIWAFFLSFSGNTYTLVILFSCGQQFVWVTSRVFFPSTTRVPLCFCGGVLGFFPFRVGSCLFFGWYYMSFSCMIFECGG